MIQLFALPERHSHAAAAVGVDDIERRQHVQQIMQLLQSGCVQASQPFTWLRASGLRRISNALLSGLGDSQALSAVLEAAYSQVLEVILSTLDRDLIQPTPPLPPQVLHSPAAAAAAAATSHSSSGPSSSWQQQQQQQQQQNPAAVSELLSRVGRYPAGLAPAAASSDELQEAFKVLRALVLLHPRSRSLMSSAQYLQLTTARACEVPDCLTHATHALLTLLAGNEEAQAMFVNNGSLDMLLTRTLQHAQHVRQAAAGAAADGSTSGAAAAAAAAAGDSARERAPGYSGRELLLQLLVFLQLLLGVVIGEAVKGGAHISSQRAALSLISRHLGPQVTAAITQGLTEVIAAAQSGATGTAGGVGAAAAAAGVPGWQMSQQLERVLLQRAESAVGLIPAGQQPAGGSSSS